MLGVFGEFLLRAYSAPKSVTNAFASIKGFHERHGFHAQAFAQPKFALYSRALPLTVRHVANPAPPLPPRLLESLCTLADTQGALGGLLAAFYSTLFYSMARASSLLPVALSVFDPSRLPTLADVQRDGTQLNLRLKWGKNFQVASEGFWVPLLPVAGSPACPVLRLSAILLANRGRPPTLPLFALPTSGRGGSLTVPLARTWLRKLLRALGQSSADWTLHSFRRGACTAAFEGGASLDDLRALGGWKSDAVRCYRPEQAARKRAATYLTNTGP